MLLISIVVGFVLVNEQISQDNKCSFQFIKVSNKYVYQVEEIGIDNDELVIKGWFIELFSIQNKIRENINTDGDLGIVLYDLEGKNDSKDNSSTNKGIPLSVSRIIRNDVNEYFKCEYDYSKCGFVAKTNLSEIDFYNGKYQIVFKVKAEGVEGISTSTFIDNGVLKYVDPRDYMELEVENTDLEEIVEKGYCVLSYPQQHICIYQYEQKLYWIAEQGYTFDESTRTYMQYQLETTQFNKLPRNRIEKGNYWSDIGGPFEAYEVTDTLNCGKYRVSVRDIPQEYSITWIYTGCYIDKWIWRRDFRPVYIFKSSSKK